MGRRALSIAMLSIHSSPLGRLGTRDTGGMSVYVTCLARELAERGHRVDLFTRRQNNADPTVTLLAPAVRLVLLDIARGRQVPKADLGRHAEEALTALEAFRRRQAATYDLVHSHYWISGQVGRLAVGSWHCPHLVTFHTLAAPKARARGSATESGRRLRAEKELVDHCDGLLVPCGGERDNLLSYYDADPGKISMVAGGVDLLRFRPMDKLRARQRLGLAEKDLVLLSVGRLTDLKGQDRILKALSRLRWRNRARLIFVGGSGPDDPAQRRLERLAAGVGVASRVCFIGSVPQANLAAYYAAADVVLSASRYESFGLVGLEALACGRPLVTTAVGVMKELSGVQRPGLIITGQSPAALAAGIDVAAARLSDWSPDAIRETARDFPWRRTAKETLLAYRNALQVAGKNASG